MDEAKQVEVQLYYKGKAYKVTLSGDITLIEKGEAHTHKSWGILRDSETGEDLWAQFDREPNLFEENISFSFNKRN